MTAATAAGSGLAAVRETYQRDGHVLVKGLIGPGEVTRAEPVEAEAGDVLVFSYLTIHGSGVNTSTEARTTWLVQFRDPADLPVGDEHTFSRGQGMMLRGRNPDSSYGGP
jgi:ectoine hydroxylase-related dioxygenase (phytanoyl-CoA dioxygenase family)